MFCYLASARYIVSETRRDYNVGVDYSYSMPSSCWNSSLFYAGISSSKIEVRRPVRSSVSIEFVSGHIYVLVNGTCLMNI